MLLKKVMGEPFQHGAGVQMMDVEHVHAPTTAARHIEEAEADMPPTSTATTASRSKSKVGMEAR